jgi:polyhydroxyalkanoate synthesis repressor PhaR
MGRVRRGPDEPTIIKKYANRRLYDTGRSSYVTLDDLCEMVQDGYDFIVQDAKTGEDLTRSVLTQIIVEQEARGHNLLPTNFLRQLIGFYGDNIQSVVPNYLEHTLDMFTKNQEQIRENINKSFEGMNVFPGMPSSIEEINRKNMEMFQRTMKMFSPFGLGEPSNEDEKKSRVQEIKRNIEELQKELKKLSNG